MENLVTFWKGKKVFITGHTGFKGSWLCLMLSHLKAEIAGYALDPVTTHNIFDAAKITNDVQDIRGDIRNADYLQKAILEFAPEVIFHLAAQPLVLYSYKYPVETYSVNVMGTVNVLEAARACNTVKAIVNITSDKCYANESNIMQPFSEESPLGGSDPYSSSKGCAELVTAAYRKSYFESQVGIASARAGNVIGGGDWSSDRLIPDLISACIHHTKLQIRSLNSIRPWQHVLESVSGYIRLAEKIYNDPNQYSGAWNFGPKENVNLSVNAVISLVEKIWNKKLDWYTNEKNLPEANKLQLNSNKAVTKLNWQPKWDIETAIRKTIEWYQKYYDNEDSRSISLQQINEYMKIQ